MVSLGSEHFYSNLLVAFCFPIALGLVLPALYCRFYRTFDLYREVFNGWLGYWGYSISGTLGQLQVPVLGVVASSAVVASFSMASKVVGPITILTASLSAVFVPELTKRLGDRLQFDSLFRSLLIVSSGYLVAVALLAWPVALLVVGIAGPQYRDSTVLVSAMVVGAAISGCSQAFNTKLLALGSPGSATRAILVGGSVALLLIVGIGATDSTGLLYVVPIAAQLVVLLLMWWSSSRAAKVVSWDKRCVVQ
jgi:O-antigen/teichoic acid export membrane protein